MEKQCHNNEQEERDADQAAEQLVETFCLFGIANDA